MAITAAMVKELREDDRRRHDGLQEGTGSQLTVDMDSRPLSS